MHDDNCHTMLMNAPQNPAETQPNPEPQALATQIQLAVQQAGGWIGFDAFMALALYAPGLGYYASGSAQFGILPADAEHPAAPGAPARPGSDFATPPQKTPPFGPAQAPPVPPALQATQTDEVWEFGAGTGALALHLLDALAQMQVPVSRYTIVDLSGSLRAAQQQRLHACAGVVRWADALPDEMKGVVVGNEVLDAMPVKLLVRTRGEWFERGVVVSPARWNPPPQGAAEFIWQDRPTLLRPPVLPDGDHDFLTEIHPQADAFICTLASKLSHGAAFFIDYGFPEAEYYHPQRHMGTVMCHRQHRADANPLADVGHKDITAHVNFTGLALSGQDAGLEVLGFCTQARFLMNCGLLDLLQNASLADKTMGQKLLLEHEMGELFKVIGLAKHRPHSAPWTAMGFAQGDRTHTL